MPRASAALSVSLASTLIASAWGQTVISARPGTITYIEGQTSLGTHSGGESLNNRLASTVSLGAGETIETGNGRAEVQLTPSIYLRVGQNSTVKMVSPSLIHTVIEVQRGRAEIEADQVFEQNDVRINLGSGPGGSQTQVVKPGRYEFDADAGVVRVFNGKAEVSLGQNSDKAISVKGGHLLALNGDSVKPQGFNKKKSTDELIEWSDLRSQYAGQENAGLMQTGGGYGNAFGPGSSGSYPWFPGYGGFASPFGLGLYSSFYGGGFGYPGLGYGFGGYPGYGFGGYPGYGFGGYPGYGYGGGGGYGYAGGSRPFSGLGNRSGYSGQFANRGGTGRPAPSPGSSGGLRGMTRSNGSGPSQSAGAGGFHGAGGGGGAAMSHGGGAAMSRGGGGGGGGSHR